MVTWAGISNLPPAGTHSSQVPSVECGSLELCYSLYHEKTKKKILFSGLSTKYFYLLLPNIEGAVRAGLWCIFETI